MNFDAFVSALTAQELHDLFMAIERRRYSQLELASATILTPEEKELANTNKIRAIRAVFKRLNCSVRTAQEIVNKHLDLELIKLTKRLTNQTDT